MDLIFQGLETYTPAIKFRQDLKTALGQIRSYPDFEEYVRLVMQRSGYHVIKNRVIQGLCVTHEIDGVLTRDDKTWYLEIKHHKNSHVYTPFQVVLAAKAKWDDMLEGNKKGLNPYRFTHVFIITNTKLSQHAKQYADCVGIDYLSWSEPNGRGLEHLIVEQKLYLTTILKGLTSDEQELLSKKRIYTLEQLMTIKPQMIDIRSPRIQELIETAYDILELPTPWLFI